MWKESLTQVTGDEKGGELVRKEGDCWGFLKDKEMATKQRSWDGAFQETKLGGSTFLENGWCVCVCVRPGEDRGLVQETSNTIH